MVRFVWEIGSVLFLKPRSGGIMVEKDGNQQTQKPRSGDSMVIGLSPIG